MEAVHATTSQARILGLKERAASATSVTKMGLATRAAATTMVTRVTTTIRAVMRMARATKGVAMTRAVTVLVAMTRAVTFVQKIAILAAIAPPAQTIVPLASIVTGVRVTAKEVARTAQTQRVDIT